MSNYHHVAHGVIDTAFTWSFGMYSISGATESSAESSWHNGVNAMFTTSAFAALLPVGVNLLGTYTSTMSAAWKQTTKTQTLATISGTATTSLPPHVAEVVTWRAAAATRYGRGRWYLPCLATTSLATGGYIMSSAAQGDIVSAVNALLSTTVGTLQFVLLHRHGTKSGPGPLTTDNIVAGDVGNTFDTQRRRAEKIVVTRSPLTF